MTTVLRATSILFLLFVSVGTLAVGVRGSRVTRPFIFPLLWDNLSSTALLLPFLAAAAPDAAIGSASHRNPVIVACIVAMAGISLLETTRGGYGVRGATGGLLRAAIESALCRAGLASEVRGSSFFLPASGVELKITDARWGTSAAIRGKWGKGRRELRALAPLIDQYLRESNCEPTLAPFFTKIGMGGFQFAFALAWVSNAFSPGP